jgi:hypothetical protein
LNQASGVTFRFKRNAKIGEAAAEMDDEFLFQSFHDVGDYAVLKNTRAPARIVVGRTGSGKTALLRMLKREQENVIEIDPENLSLNYLSNNEVIKFFEGLGVKLDLFYGLLWRHVFTVELLRARYQLTTSEKTQSFFLQLFDRLKSKDKSRERALKYIQDWGDKFWIETEYRVKEFTTKLESELKAGAGIDVDALKLNASGGLMLTEEKKNEIVHRGQQVVNNVQIKELSEVISYLNDEVFMDPQRPYFIVIDRLDENWIEDSIRFKLIRALIETVKAFQRVQNVKIVVAMRKDLLQKVFGGYDHGVQEEKYQALFLRLRWSQSQLEAMLDRRFANLVRQQYTQREVKLRELFPSKMGRLSFVDYFMQRTALRPRDAILFVNDCIARSEAHGEVRVQTVYEAEKEYSKLRLKSLVHEWGGLYPSLAFLLPILEHAPVEAKVSSLGRAIDDAIQKLAEVPEGLCDSAIEAARTFLDSSSGNKNSVISEMVLVLFKTGAVGLRFEGGGGQMWADEHSPPTPSQIKSGTKLLVHPMFHQALATVYQ